MAYFSHSAHSAPPLPHVLPLTLKGPGAQGAKGRTLGPSSAVITKVQFGH